MCTLDKRGGLDAAAKAAGVELKVLQLDVQNANSVNAAVAEAIAAEGRIDVLVNNAGAGFARSTEQAPEADVQWVIDVNFLGVVRCVRTVMPHMRAARRGHVVAVSSVGGLVGQPFNEIYCGAKFAVEGYMEAMASYIPPNFGIHFIAVEPGGIKSEFAANVLKQIAKTGGMRDDAYAPILQAYIARSACRQDSGTYQSADEVVAVVMQVINAESPPIRTRISSWDQAWCKLKTQLDPDGKKMQAQVIKQFLG